VYVGTRILVLSQYYEDERGPLPAGKRGAKVVADYPLPRAALATDVKRSAEFVELVSRIRREGFDPEFRRHVDRFNLKHPHSFRTPLCEQP
jgi:NitT/TauT family transport system ATP-binding protein